MNYCGFSKYDTANGDGVRVSVFVSGCTVHCKGCFNKESWDFNYGKPFTDETIDEILKALDNPYVSGLSILGGDPFEHQNMPTVLKMIKAVRSRFGSSKNIWIWSGRTLEKLKHDPMAVEILDLVDTLVDGPFIEKLKISKQGQYKGSSNQRIIHFLH